MSVVECVANFSEGRDPAVIDAVAGSVREVRGAWLLHVDAGPSANRTVLTFAGSPDAVLEAAYRATRTACELIDLTRHDGVHPRLGAMDVVPFVPVSGVTLAECAALSRRFGRRVGEELGVPVYLYEAAQAHRRSLSRIRAGGYRGLAERSRRPEWRPDYGPATLDPATGATVTGARFFLIAYNVNVRGTAAQAHALAENVRGSGRMMVSDDGSRVREPGYFPTVKAIGWEIEEYGLAQVSMNLDDYRRTGMSDVHAAIDRDARAMGLATAGSEVVGLVPLEAMLLAAEAFVRRKGLEGLSDRARVDLVVDRLGLDSVRPFDPDEKVLEWALRRSRSSAR